MKRLIQFVSRLYPASWRCRYGSEFAALLEDVDPDWHTFLNVLRGGVDMQIRTWNFGNILVVAGTAGALVGLAAWFAMPNRYASTAVLKIALSPHQPATNKSIADYVNNLAEQSMSRSSLIEISNALKLYQPETTSLSDILGSMEKDITIKPIGRQSDKGTVFSIQFVYSDPVTAQRVVGALASKFLDSNLYTSLRDNKPDAGGPTLEVLDAASLTNRPFSPRLPRIMTAGTAAGLTLGTLLALFRRLMRPARSTETK